VTVLDNRLHLVCGVLLTFADARHKVDFAAEQDEVDSPLFFIAPNKFQPL